VRLVQFTPTARRDVLEIWEYTARESVAAADRVVAAIEAATRRLSELPGIGHTRPDVADNRYRFWRVYSYLVACRFTDAELTVVRVAHGAQDMRRVLHE